MKKLFLSLAACAAMLSASASDTWQLGPYAYQADTLFHVTAGPGVTTTGVRLSTSSNKTNIFYSTIDLTNPNIELRGVQAKDNGDVVENVNSMGNRKNQQGNGQYIAGVNSDFFNMKGSPTRTNGHSIVDGTLYNTGVGGEFWQKWATYAVVEGKKDIRLLQGVNAARNFKFANGETYPYRINGARYADYLVIYTASDDTTTTKTNPWGGECTMKLLSGSLETNDAVFEVTSAPTPNGTGGNMAVPNGGYVLSGHGAANALIQTLKVGDQVGTSFSVTYNGEEINPTQLVGGCSYIVADGKIAPDEYFSDDVIDHFGSNQARTVIGYNADRTKLIILVADKYSTYAMADSVTTKVKDPEKLSYGTSTGMLLQRMGHIMLHLGCTTAMNFDGGGSSQLYNKNVGIVNVPYGDSYLRPVANGFFAVSTTPEDNEIASIEVRQKNVNVNEGETFVPVVYGYNKYGVLVDNNVQGVSLTVAPSLGTSTTSRGDNASFTAGDAKGTTIAVVELPAASTDAPAIKCGVRISTNGGGEYVTSGGDDLPIMATAEYEADAPMGPDSDTPLIPEVTPLFLTEQWHFVNPDFNDGWDGNDPNWESEDAIKAEPCPRFATARNGRFYTVDMRSMSIAEITPEGEIVPLYKLPSLEGRVINGVPDYYGCAISSDDAGNFLIGHLFTKNDTYRVWTVYDPKTGKAKHFDIELPEGEGSNGRIDNIGRVVGDLTKDAYVYVAPKATANLDTQKALIIHFTGNSDVDNVTATPTMSKGMYMAGSGNTGSTIQPKYATVAEMEGVDLNDTFYWYSKVGGIGQWNQDLFTFINGDFSVNYCQNWNNASALNGFDTFILGDKRYFVVGFAGEGEKQNNQHIAIFDENNNRIAEWNNPDYTSSYGYITITAVPVNDKQVNIYLYNCTADYYVNEVKTGAIAGALLSFTLGSELEAYEPADITPEGYKFDTYADGDVFKLTATGSNGGWSCPADFYHATNPGAFDEDGQLTAFLMRAADSATNSQEWVDTNIQPNFAVRKVNDFIGQALVINEAWSPTATVFGWPYKNFPGTLPQLSFFMRNEDITARNNERHYIRVRLVYNVLERGCHYALDVANPDKKETDYQVVKSIYASNEGNWVVPELDYKTGELYAETGIDFAKWVDETGRDEDIPAVPVVYEPADTDSDPWDLGHHNDGVVNDPNKVKVPYLMNGERFRVYEFDTYIDNPEKRSLSVQLNFLNRNASYIIKEIKFTDLGTDEAAANLLRKRSLSWIYYNAETSGIENIVTDGAVDTTDAPAHYYNLQGVEVKNPDNGVYIVRRGNTVTKEYIRK